MKDNFKIIAIKTGSKPKNILNRKGIKYDYLKILKEDTIYSFYSNYKFPNDDLTEILNSNVESIENLYHFNDNTSLNINAIVGSNGSGKSTLIELFFWANYNIGSKLGILRDHNGKVYSPFRFLDFEILYQINNENFICISLNKDVITKFNYRILEDRITREESGLILNKIDDLEDFFYSIVINYSLYALNSLEIGDWIIPLFHKNDGYQTPLVLNPMRTDGEININKEKRLLTRRLLANILEDIGDREEINSLRNIANGKIAKRLKLSYISNPELEEPKGEIIEEIVENIKKIFKVEINQEQLDNNFFINITLNYIYEKLKKISRTYRPYNKYKKGNSIKWINSFLKNIYESDSHIGFKVKGAILYIKYYTKIFYNNQEQFNRDSDIYLSVSKLSSLIMDININEEFWVNTFMMVPPSFFKIEIIPDDDSSFDFLSSGEKQRIHSISSIIYHLINLNSVEQLKAEKVGQKYISYRYVNIVLDEIELYYHPEWQRRYISDLIDYLERVNPKNLDKIKGININILTHSPYILSDIPLSNTLRLEKGKSTKSDNDNLQTFGANIHNLLANDFFMKDGFMGEWSKRKINEAIIFLNYFFLKREYESTKHKLDNSKKEQLKTELTNVTDELKKNHNSFIHTTNSINYSLMNSNRVYYYKIIKNIGEPVLQSKLMDMYNELFPTENKEEIKKRILELGEIIGYTIELKKKE